MISKKVWSPLKWPRFQFFSGSEMDSPKDRKSVGVLTKFIKNNKTSKYRAKTQIIVLSVVVHYCPSLSVTVLATYMPPGMLDTHYLKYIPFLSVFVVIYLGGFSLPNHPDS